MRRAAASAPGSATRTRAGRHPFKDVTELAAVQARLLENVASALKPGGRLVYSVCTLTRAETTAVANAFTAAHPELTPIPAFVSQPSALLPQNGDEWRASSADKSPGRTAVRNGTPLSSSYGHRN